MTVCTRKLAPPVLKANVPPDFAAVLGDTFFHSGQTVEPLEGFRETKPMVFAGVYPYEPAQFPQLEESVKRVYASRPELAPPGC